MRKLRISRLTGSLGLAAALALGFPSPATSASTTSEQHFDTLTIGTHTYSNVTVTTRSKSYVFLLHSAGMVNVKVSDLSQEEKEVLGYEIKKPTPNPAAAWAKSTLTKIETPQVKELEKQIQAAAARPPADIVSMLKPMISLPVLALILGFMFAFYVFFCYCSMLICRKAGTEPGALVWIPVLQMIPLIKAAKMSSMWFLAGFLPVLNVIAHLIWCVKIAEARGKSFWTAIFLILPFTNLFAYLYLAFSDGDEPREAPPKRAEMLVLTTA